MANQRLSLLIALLAASVTLAGCADEGDATGNSGTPTIDSGKGAINGLLIDDRFRPIAGGSVLLQEAGLTATSNANGEFQFLNVDPGTYTAKVTAEGHESAPRKVQVTAGAFVELHIEARRAASLDGVIITNEYNVFLDCVISAVIALPFDCSTDLSGDSHRRSFTADYTEFGANATVLVSEMVVDRQGRYEVDLWWPDGEGIPFYSNEVFSGDSIRMTLRYGETDHEHEAIFENDNWTNEYPILTEIIVYGALSEEGGEIEEFFLGGGVGVQFAVQARFLNTLFLGEPQVDVDSYCVLIC